MMARQRGHAPFKHSCCEASIAHAKLLWKMRRSPEAIVIARISGVLDKEAWSDRCERQLISFLKQI
jgi:hypothetical protein